jgi:hypothetical protein
MHIAGTRIVSMHYVDRLAISQAGGFAVCDEDGRSPAFLVRHGCPKRSLHWGAPRTFSKTRSNRQTEDILALIAGEEPETYKWVHSDQ